MSDSQLADALKFTSEQAKATIKPLPTIIPLNTEPEGHYLLVKHDGTYTEHYREPEPMNHRFETAMELVTFIGALAPDPKEAAIFLDSDGATFVPDRNDPRPKARVELDYTSRFETLQKFAGTNGSQPMDQRSFLALFRISFRGCLSGSNLVQLLRDLKFVNNAAGEGNIQHGQESLGRSIVAKVAGVDAIPEDITIHVPVFDGYGQSQPVACAIEIMTQEQRFRLIPFPGEVERAEADALDYVRGILAENTPKIPVYLGEV